MAELQDIKEQLNELESLTKSPVFAMSKRIVEHLEVDSRQYKLSIGGLRESLHTNREEDKVLIEAAFILTVHPFEVLDIQYRFYDRSLSEVLEVLNKQEYANIINEGVFFQDGETLTLTDFQSRTFPLFINKYYSLALSSFGKEELEQR